MLSILLFTHIDVKAATSKTYSVKITRYSQNKTNWCWAACAQMIGNYYGNNKSQKTICKKIKGKSINEGASDDELETALKYVTSKKWSAMGMFSIPFITKNCAST